MNSAGTHSSGQRSELPALGLLAVAVLIAWLPMLHEVVPVADDHPYLQLSSLGWMAYIDRLGFWRILGQHVPAILWLSHPLLPSVVILVVHLAATLLLYGIARVGLGGRHLPVGLALGFGVFPFGYQAQLWLIAGNYVYSTAFFLTNLLWLLTAERRHPAITATGSLLFALASALCNEVFILALAASGLFVWPRNRVLALAPAAGALVWIALFKLHDISHYKAVAMNPATLLSTFYYQYTLLDIFEPWLSAETRTYLTYGWTPLLAVGLGLGLLGATWLSRQLTEATPQKAPSWFTGAVLLLMLLGIAGIYSLGGGYSLDSRKKYVLLPGLLLAAGWLWRMTKGSARLHQVSPALIWLLLFLGIPSCWLVTGIWRHESLVTQRLVDLLARESVTAVALHRNPDMAQAWPTFSRSLGYSLDDEWVLALALQARNAATVRISATAPVQAHYDRTRGDWQLRSTLSP